MARQNRWLLVFILLAVLLVGAFGAQAQAGTWYVASLNTLGCANGATNFTTTVAGIPVFPTTLRFRTIVDAGGLRYMDEDAGTPGSNGNYGWSLYNSSSGGPTTATFPIPPNTQINIQFLLINGVGGPTVSAWEVILSQCNGGTMIYNGLPGGFGGAGPSCLSTPDGRLNDSPAVDCAAPVVLYRDSDSFDIYGVNPSNSQGILLIQLAPSQYEGDAPSSTVLLEEVVNPASGQPIQVYQLAGGGIQVNAPYPDGKLYSVAWTPTGGLTHLAW